MLITACGFVLAALSHGAVCGGVYGRATGRPRQRESLRWIISGFSNTNAHNSLCYVIIRAAAELLFFFPPAARRAESFLFQPPVSSCLCGEALPSPLDL